MPDLRLRVNGIEYSGWKSIRVTRSIECVAGSFDLSISDKWVGQPTRWPIVEQDACTVLLGDHVMITGFVDRRRLSFGPTDHSMSVEGRDQTGDLVDCSAIDCQGEFKNVDLLTFATRVAKPFDIPVKMQAGLEVWRIPKLSVDPGDTAFEAIERACRMVGVLPVSDGLGGLVLTRAGAARATTALVEGENILAASADLDVGARFHLYRVVGQRQGSDQDHGKATAAVWAEGVDAGVVRKRRKLLVRAEGSVTPESAMQRAEWESVVRAARGANVTVTVQGWTQGDGSPWPVNARVPVRSPNLGIEGEMLITGVTYGLDEGSGTTATLTLKRPDAFLPEPVVEEKPAAMAAWPELAGAKPR